MLNKVQDTAGGFGLGPSSKLYRYLQEIGSPLTTCLGLQDDTLAHNHDHDVVTLQYNLSLSFNKEPTSTCFLVNFYDLLEECKNTGEKKVWTDKIDDNLLEIPISFLLTSHFGLIGTPVFFILF